VTLEILPVRAMIEGGDYICYASSNKYFFIGAAVMAHASEALGRSVKNSSEDTDVHRIFIISEDLLYQPSARRDVTSTFKLDAMHLILAAMHP